METVVIGHRNPDMDSICSAVAYAELKRRLGDENVRAARAGALNERISYVLERFGVEQPYFLPDATPRVRDVMVSRYVAAGPDTPVSEALALMSSRNLRALPVVGEDREFCGVLSENKLLGLVLPSLEAGPRARQVLASLHNIAATFDGTSLTGPLPREETDYSLLVAAMRIEMFLERVSQMDPEHTILFVGDRENVQIEALRAGVKAIVATGGTSVPEELIREARVRGASIISSPVDTASSVLFARGAMTVRHTMEHSPESFEAETAAATARRTVSLSNKLIFPVLDERGRLEGIVSKSDFLKAPARQLILVDHNEISQAVPGATEVPIAEILDHHRLGNMPTDRPILFINQPVGSTCTLVADLYERSGIQPEGNIAGLMLAGIIADTLNGNSPTTTDTDRRFLRELSKLAGVAAEELAAEIFAVGSPLRTLTPQQIVTADAKEYTERGQKFSVSQIEEITFGQFDLKREQLLDALQKRAESNGYLFAALLVTDIKTQNSYLLAAGDPDFLRAISYPEQADRVWLLEGVVSRKKQLLPYLTECLARVR